MLKTIRISHSMLNGFVVDFVRVDEQGEYKSTKSYFVTPVQAISVDKRATKLFGMYPLTCVFNGGITLSYMRD